MTRWPAIAALGVMAGPVCLILGAALSPDPALHFAASETLLVAGVAALVVVLWWTGWTMLLVDHRRSASAAGAPTRAISRVNFVLALWFALLLGAGIYAARNFVPL
jgi:hypothetical protein